MMTMSGLGPVDCDNGGDHHYDGGDDDDDDGWWCLQSICY